MSSTLRRRGSRLAIILIFISSAAAVWPGRSLSRSGSGADSCLECHKRSPGRAGEVAALHLKSSHSQLSCSACHGGDPAAADKTRSHAGDFIGKPGRDATLAMCGSCHTAPLAQFKKSRHYLERSNGSRLDCAECHGAHTVGDPPETFSFVSFCAGCHGLEYLPELPMPVQEMLAVSDELRDAQRLAEWKKREIPASFIAGRRDLRRRISEIVHPTDARAGGGLDKIPEIIKLGRELKAAIGN